MEGIGLVTNGNERTFGGDGNVLYFHCDDSYVRGFTHMSKLINSYN